MSDKPERYSLAVPVYSLGEWALLRLAGPTGDPQKLVPVASEMLGALKQNMDDLGINYGHRFYQLDDGTKVRVIRNYDQNIIEITTPPSEVEEGGFFQIFLETGWVFLARTNMIFNEHKPAGSITLTQQMVAAISKVPPLDYMKVLPPDEIGFYGRAYTQYMDSKALPEYPVFASPADDTRSAYEKAMALKSLQARGYFNGALLGFRAFPSALTGKAKLYFQAQLGKDKPTQGIIVSLSAFAYTSGAGLYSTDDLQYYWIIVTLTGITVHQLRPIEPQFSLLRTVLLKIKGSLPFDRFTKYEAYLLSLLEYEFVQSATILSGMVLQGGPLAYNWKFSWHGKTAKCVRHLIDGDDYTRHSRTYTLEFTQNSDFNPDEAWSTSNAPLAVEFTESAPTAWWPTLDCPIWIPDLLLGGMALGTPNQKSGYSFFNFDVTLYGFFDHITADKSADSQWVSVNLAVATGDGKPDPFAAVGSYLASQSNRGGMTWNSNEDRTFGATRLYTTGHTGDIDFGGESREDASGSLAVSMTLTGVTATFRYGAWPIEDYYTNYGALGRADLERFGSGVYAGAFLVLPFYSAEAAYCGDVRRTTSRHLRSANEKSIIGEFTTTTGISQTANLSQNMASTGDVPIGMANCGGGVSDCSTTTLLNEELYTVNQRLLCSVIHSRGSDAVEFKINSEHNIESTIGPPNEPGFGKWDVVWFANPTTPGNPGDFWFYSGVSNAAFMTNDIAAGPNDPSLWKAVGGLTLEQSLTGYFVGWA
jgi:hypothetical protein